VSPIYVDLGDATVGTDEFWVRVLPVCSGYEGIGLIVVFLSAYLVGFRERFRFPQALLLLPIAIVAVWGLNVVRIVVLILVGRRPHSATRHRRQSKRPVPSASPGGGGDDAGERAIRR
jgi:exosortase/archaeosortase family protein